jgi:tRNA dimethylallyltransferase
MLPFTSACRRALQYACACYGNTPAEEKVPADDLLVRPLKGASEPLLVVVLGPTGSGKSVLSLVLAERFHGEIVNCDSVALYRDFEIGTAKPTPADRARIPHHLFDCADPKNYVTAGEYARMARQVLAEIRARGHLPIVVGGTGLYLRALVEGLFPGPERSEQLRTRLREQAGRKGSQYLHRVLDRLDQAAAAKIHPNDQAKLIRAIEVCLATRQRLTELWEHGRTGLEGFRVLRLGLNPDRQVLYRRINQRAIDMFAAGLVEETRQLVERYGIGAYPLGVLGYKQAIERIRGEMDDAAALQAAQQAHRNYAKRQMTWFRREPGVHWLDGFGDEAAIQQGAIGLIEKSIQA